MSYTQLLIHAIVRTHKSEPTLPIDEKAQFLYKEMWGIIKNKGGRLYRINSMPDHVHLLFTLPPRLPVSQGQHFINRMLQLTDSGHGAKVMPRCRKAWKTWTRL